MDMTTIAINLTDLTTLLLSLVMIAATALYSADAASSCSYSFKRNKPETEQHAIRKIITYLLITAITIGALLLIRQIFLSSCP